MMAFSDPLDLQVVAELTRLNADEIRDQGGPRVNHAIDNLDHSYSRMQRLDRELRRAREEEEFLMQAAQIFLND